MKNQEKINKISFIAGDINFATAIQFLLSLSKKTYSKKITLTIDEENKNISRIGDITSSLYKKMEGGKCSMRINNNGIIDIIVYTKSIKKFSEWRTPIKKSKKNLKLINYATEERIKGLNQLKEVNIWGNRRMVSRLIPSVLA